MSVLTYTRAFYTLMSMNSRIFELVKYIWASPVSINADTTELIIVPKMQTDSFLA